MKSKSPTAPVAALIVLIFAGSVGAASAYSSFKSTGALNAGLVSLAALCLSAAVIMASHLARVIREMRQSAAKADRWFAIVAWLSVSLGLVGSIIAAGLFSTPGAITDKANDAAVYAAAALLGISILSICVAGLMAELKWFQR